MTSVEAGGEATGVNVGGLSGLRCEAPTHSCVTSVEADGESAFLSMGLGFLGWRSLPVAVRQGVAKRCRLSWLANSALVYEPQMRGEEGSCGVSANEYSCTQEPK